jgi:hypothetical protein
MRSDRLPTSDRLLETCGISYSLQQNQNFAIYVIPDEGTFDVPANTGGSSGVVQENDNDDIPNFTSELLQTTNNCRDSRNLACYDFNPNGQIQNQQYPGGGKYIVNSGPCQEFSNKQIFDNGCYKLVTKVLISLPEDIRLIIEWVSRTNITFGACRNVFSHLFTQNWVNGTLYAFAFKNNKFFDISKIDIEVTDITNDLNNYAKFDEIISNIPNTSKDPNTNKTILDPKSPYSCFYNIIDDKPIIKGENKYNQNYQNSLKELFQFDEEIFKYSMKDDASKVELGIKLHNNFNEGDKNLNNELGYNIIRVDFKISDFNDKTVSELEKFTWKSMWKDGESNSGFAKSVEEVIKSTQPKGKTIHTLFIKFIKV